MSEVTSSLAKAQADLPVASADRAIAVLQIYVSKSTNDSVLWGSGRKL